MFASVYYVDYASSSAASENLDAQHARHGKFGFCSHPRRRASFGSRYLLAPLRSVVCRPELFPRSGTGWPIVTRRQTTMAAGHNRVFPDSFAFFRFRRLHLFLT